MKSRKIVVPSLARTKLLLAAFITGLTLVIGCSGSFVASKWREQQIRIDGDAGDWSDSTAYAGNDDVGVKVTNDDEYLYLLLVTQNREIARQMVTRGLMVWFDPNGGDKQTIGLHYPVGVMGLGGRFQQEMDPSGDASRRGAQEFEFFGPTERDRVRLPRTQGKGIEVQIAERENRFVYEAKIPLIFSLNHPYAIETSTGSTVGLTIETTSGRETLGRPGGQGGGLSGAGGGRRGRGAIGGASGQAPRGAEVAQFEPMKLKLRLAERIAPK